MALLYSHDHNVFLHVISVRVRSVELCVERFEYKHGHIRLIYSTNIPEYKDKRIFAIFTYAFTHHNFSVVTFIYMTESPLF